MRLSKKVLIGMVFVFGILLMSSFIVAAYTRTNAAYTQFGSTSTGGGWGVERDICEAGQDFVVQIAPFGCSPAVVRQDLLEEQEVPVFCQLAATKFNPMIDVDVIESISFPGDRPEGVRDIGFHHARSALGGREDLNSPVLNNIGYAVIVLKKQKNSSEMPDFVEGNLTAKLRYDIKNAFGIGKVNFYLPELTDIEFERVKDQYSFWDGRGLLRAEGIDGEGASIKIYDGQRRQISNFNLEKGEISDAVQLPGMECLTGLQVRLDNLDPADTRARFDINGQIVEVVEDESFLEGRCRVTSIDKKGLIQEVRISCKEDEGRENFDLRISPQVSLKIGDQGPKDYEVGDYLYSYEFTYREELEKYAESAGKKIGPAVEELKRVKDDLNKALGELALVARTANEDVQKADRENAFFTSVAYREAREDAKKKLDIVKTKLKDVGQYIEGLEIKDTLTKINPSDLVPEDLKEYYSFFAEDAQRLTNVLSETDVDTPTLNSYGETMLDLKANFDKGVRIFSSSVVGFGEKLKAKVQNLGTEILDTKVSKHAYIGFIGVEGNSVKTGEVYVHLLSKPDKTEELSEREISSVARFDVFLSSEEEGFSLLNIGKSTLGVTSELITWLSTGHSFETLYPRDGQNHIWGSSVQFLGLAGPQDKDLSSTDYVGVLENYDLSNKDYTKILSDYSNEKDNAGKLYGEKALNEKMDLAYKTGQMKTFAELCEQFKEDYSDSDLIGGFSEECSDNVLLSSLKASTHEAEINSQVKLISFKGIYEPSLDDYSVDVSIDNAGASSGRFTLGKDQLFWFDSRTEFISLRRLTEDYAVFDMSVVSSGIAGRISSRRSVKVELGETEILGDGRYQVSVNKINIKNSAKVSIIPSILNTGTETSFQFKIGIEKRAIELSPEKTKKKIESLNETIAKWTDRSEKLGTVVKGLKTACLGVGTALTIKNLVTNTGGKAIARREVMRNENGWYNLCDGMSGEGKEYISREKCLIDKADKINADVDEYFKILNEQNEEIKRVQDTGSITKKGWLGERSIDDVKFKEEFVKELKENLDLSKTGNTIEINGASVEVSDILGMIGGDSVSIETLRSLQLNSRLSNSDSDSLKKIASEQVRLDLTDIYVNGRESAEEASFLEDLKNKGLSGMNPKTYSKEESIEAVYQGKVVPEVGIFGMAKGTPIESIVYGNQRYLVKLEKTGSGGYYQVMEVYDLNGDVSTGGDSDEIRKKFSFRKYDSSTYENPFKSSYGESVPTIKYYEREPYKGLPAVVPFDCKKGWYAYIKPTLPVAGAIASYDASGRVTSFYLCNVGENGKEEKMGGDDICQMINTGTRQPYNVFSGLSSGEASRLTEDAIKYVEQASRKYEKGLSGDITIGNCKVKVGSPAVEIPDMQCEDFMSPKECQLLFNVCDPVVCPSSRCDLGGAYPVKDVIQSGIVGSIALCLPNFAEGIYVPVCLTGIKAGIDSLLSVYTSYGSCLQESLDSGEMVGICDEIYSIHMCEFFWRQSIPLANLAIPRILEFVTGQNVRGGGEYLGVQSAWNSAQDSITYFTQYYAANSYKAFKARSTEEVGGEVCKSFVSATAPEGKGLLDTLTDPDSPPQYYGRFDEIPFTTATNPPISHYKVFYHIYAGKDSRAYYNVYLKGDTSSSFYRDTSSSRFVNSGYIQKGGYATETKDFTAPSGYKELCINVNGIEECGFTQATTSFAVNYVAEQYAASQIDEKDIKSERECIAGSPSAYSLLNPNLQEGIDEAINPAIYNRGIIRICATNNPGKGTDASAGMDGSRWVEVGYCDDQKIRCWLDQDSVKDIIKNTELESKLLKEQNENYQKILIGDEYLQEGDFAQKLQEINKEEDNENKIELVNLIIDKVFMNAQKAGLLLLRGNAYGSLAKGAYAEVEAELEAKRAKIITAEEAAAAEAARIEADVEAIEELLEHEEVEGVEEGDCIENGDISYLLGEDCCSGCSKSGGWICVSCEGEIDEDWINPEGIYSSEALLAVGGVEVVLKEGERMRFMFTGEGKTQPYVHFIGVKTINPEGRIIIVSEFIFTEFVISSGVPKKFKIDEDLEDDLIVELKKVEGDRAILSVRLIDKTHEDETEEEEGVIEDTVSEVIRIYFDKGEEDDVFLRWNYETGKPEVFVLPDGKLKKKILNKQKWSSDLLSISSFGDMYEEDIIMINSLLSKNSIEELAEELVDSVLIAQGDLEIFNRVTDEKFDDKSGRIEIRNYVRLSLLSKKPMPVLPDEETVFVEKFDNMEVTYYLKFDSLSKDNRWRGTNNVKDYFPDDWRIIEFSTSRGMFSLELANFEQGVFLFTYLYEYIKADPSLATWGLGNLGGLEGELSLIKKDENKFVIYFEGRSMELYLEKVEGVGYFVYHPESFGFDWLNPDTKMGVFIYDAGTRSYKRFERSVSTDSGAYEDNKRIMNILEQATLTAEMQGNNPVLTLNE